MHVHQPTSQVRTLRTHEEAPEQVDKEAPPSLGQEPGLPVRFTPARCLSPAPRAYGAASRPSLGFPTWHWASPRPLQVGRNHQLTPWSDDRKLALLRVQARTPRAREQAVTGTTTRPVSQMGTEAPRCTDLQSHMAAGGTSTLPRARWGGLEKGQGRWSRRGRPACGPGRCHSNPCPGQPRAGPSAP